MTDVAPGHVVILNGAPRAGKTSIAKESSMTPPRCQPGIGLRPGEEAHPAAPFVPTLYAALYDSVAAHSRLGLNVAVDVGHHDPATSIRSHLIEGRPSSASATLADGSLT